MDRFSSDPLHSMDQFCIGPECIHLAAELRAEGKIYDMSTTKDV